MAIEKQGKRVTPRVKSREPGSDQLEDVLAELRARASGQVKKGMARYAIPSDKALGIPVGALRGMGKRLGPNHELAAELWATDIYEARMLATFVDDPELVTPAQMDAWCRDFDSWAICDTACLALFDRTPHAFRKVEQWSKKNDEFVKRAAFALLASLTVHDKAADDAAFLRCLPLVERAAEDPRNFVMKAVNWALRSIGKRSAVLHAEAVQVSRRLAARPEPAPRWVGKSALRELESASVLRRLKAKRAAKAPATTSAVTRGSRRQKLATGARRAPSRGARSSRPRRSPCRS